MKIEAFFFASVKSVLWSLMGRKVCYKNVISCFACEIITNEKETESCFGKNNIKL